jgi:hypothetical protein
MSVKQAEIIPGVYSRVMNFDWIYTDQSKMSAILIISSKKAIVPNDPTETIELLGLKFEDSRMERVGLIQRRNNNHIDIISIVIDRNEKVGEEIEFEY